MIVSHKHKFIFVKTRKTAGTSLEIGLSQYCGPDDIITPISPEDELTRQELGFRGPQNCRFPLTSYRWPHIKDTIRGKRPLFRNHMSAGDAIRLLGEDVWNEYFTFTIEREPYSKAISRYWWSTRKRTSRPTIEKFLENIRPDFLSNWDIYSVNDKPAVDMMLRFENLQEDRETLEQKLGIGPITMPRAKGNYRKDRRHYSQVLSPEARRRLEIVCAKEIQYFGYEWCEAEQQRAA